MSTRTLLLGAAAAFLLVAPASAGMPDGWYLSLEGGGSWVQDWDVSAPGTSTGTISFDNGWAALATVGYGRGRWSAEFEAGYRKNDLDTFTPNDVETQSINALRLEEASFMANVRYTYPLMEKLSLTAGAGAGADYAQMKLTNGGGSGEDEDWNFAYQGIVGLNYAVGQRSEIFVDYRYFRTGNANFDFQPQLSSFLEGDDFVKHTATIGFRYHLNGGAAAPVVTDTPTVSDAGPSEYIVFFGHNKSDLTAAAIDVIKEAAAAAKDNGSANLKLVGHTDRSGSDSYNQALSMRRANAVKAALVAEGVAAGSISLDGKGESDPMVPTADGVREPQNRRVNISL